MTTLGLMFSFICIIFFKLLVLHFSMGIGVQSKAFVAEDLSQMTKLVQELIARDEIVIFSKTYCPYCKMAKEVFDNLQCKYTVIELDQRDDGSAIQTVLGQMTGVRTVPRVFINGRCVGGGNEIKALFNSGHLSSMLNAVGVPLGVSEGFSGEQKHLRVIVCDLNEFGLPDEFVFIHTSNVGL